MREIRADLAGRIAHLWLSGDGRRVSTLDLLGEGLTLFTGPRDGAWRAAAGVRTPVQLATQALDELTARGLGIAGAGALLVRPDGLPVRLWPDAVGAAAELRRAVEALVAPEADLRERRAA